MLIENISDGYTYELTMPFIITEKRYSLLFSYTNEDKKSRHAAIALSLDNEVYLSVRNLINNQYIIQ